MPALDALKPYLPKDQVIGRGWCGPTCMANGMALYGLPATPEACAGAAGVDHQEGMTPEDMKKGLKAFGFRLLEKDVRDSSPKSHRKTLEWVEKQTKAGKFVMCVINGNYEESHWILLLNVVRGGVHIWDPNDSYSKVVSRANLFRAWWNVTAPEDTDPEQDPNQIWLGALSPRSRLARRAVEIRRNLLNPPRGVLPTDKKIPTEFSKPEDVPVVGAIT